MSKYIQIADNLFRYIQTNQKRIKVFYLQNTMSCDIIRQENSPEYLAIQGSYSKTVLAFDLSDGDAYATIPRCSIYRSIHECCVIGFLSVSENGALLYLSVMIRMTTGLTPFNLGGEECSLEIEINVLSLHTI